MKTIAALISMMIVQAVAQLPVLSWNVPDRRTSSPVARIGPRFQHML